MRVRLTVLLLGALLGLAACEVGPPPMVVPENPNPPVPPLQSEVRPLPPVSEDQLVWRMGEWEWVGTGYVWAPGEWVKLDGHSNQYLPGHWVFQGGAWQWERGHWL